ncbi:TetR/AcrR family transcriptional regulator [Parasphingorhabdus pacifica]
MARPRAHDEALRTRLLERAGELLNTDGPEGLSLRRLAGDVNTSTTAVYSLFGGKPGLIRELYVEGFRRLGDRMERVALSNDPAADLTALGHAYRESALANHNFYSLMFGNAVPNFAPDAEARAQSRRSLRALEETVRRAIESDVFTGTEPNEVVFAAWGLVHGLVSLELNGSLPSETLSDEESRARYERALHRGMAGWRRHGDDRAGQLTAPPA